MLVIDYKHLEAASPLWVNLAISVAEAQIGRRPTGARKNVIEARLRLLRAEKARRAALVGPVLTAKLARAEGRCAACC